MKYPKSIFREYDIRGLAGKELTRELARDIGLVYSEYAWNGGTKRKTPLISVGRDCRLTSDEYAEGLIAGLTEGGCDVVDLGVCPTPLTYFSVFARDLDGGIMVTGSHNPAEYNGFKICLGKDTIHGEEIQRIREKIEAGPKTRATRGTVSKFDVIPAYQEDVANRAKKVRRMKIVLDAGNGTAATVAPELFRRMGADVIELFCTLDGKFPNHHPDPTVAKNLQDLIQTVIREKADFGIAFDGDSDRIGLVDEKGQVIYGDEMMVLFARDVLAENPGATVISEVKSSYRLYDDIAHKGGKPIMWKTGHSLIKSKMKETKAKLAGEMSGHIFFADRYYGYDDAIYAGTRAYEIASAASGPFSSLLADLEKTVNTPEIRVDCREELKFQIVEETKTNLEGAGKINPIDGIRIDFGDGWGLVRASNTQPVIVLRFEAKTASRLAEIRSIVEGGLNRAAEKLGHPPLKEDSHH